MKQSHPSALHSGLEHACLMLLIRSRPAVNNPSATALALKNDTVFWPLWLPFILPNGHRWDEGIAGCQEVPMCFSALLCYLNKVYSLWINRPYHSPPLFPPAPRASARGSCTEERSHFTSHITLIPPLISPITLHANQSDKHIP